MLDWQTDGDPDSEVWDAPPPQPIYHTLKKQLLRHWRTLLVLLILAAAAVGLLLRQIQQRVNASAAQMRADVQQTHETVWQTAVSADADLYPLFLSTKDRQWLLFQRFLLSQNLIAHRAPLGLWLDETAVSNPATSITHTVYLTPDFRMAEVKSLLPYLTQQPDGSLKQIVLAQTAVYAQNSGRWLQANPQQLDSFWGPLKINRAGEHVTVIYPNRDKVIGRRLLADLDDLVKTLCQNPTLACPPAFSYRIYFSPDSNSFIPLTKDDLYRLQGSKFHADHNQPSSEITQITLPTPTLIGIPQNEAGYAALLRGYAAWVAVHIINDAGREPPPYKTIVTILAELDLLPPPVPEFNPNSQPPSASLPNDNLWLLCRDRGEDAELWQYTPAADVWKLLDAAAMVRFFDVLAAKETVSVSSPLSTVRVPDEQELLTAVPLTQQPSALTITHMWQHENRRIFLAKSSEDDTTHYLFVLDLDTGTIQYLDRLSLSVSLLRRSALSENGRFLTLVSYTSKLGHTRLILYDLQQQTDQIVTINGLPFNRYGWTADEQWLFALNSRSITLITPATHDRTLIYHQHYGCETAVWMPQNSTTD
ncbi:MAG: hypothetical protein KC421_13370 [Anaerolineales bacterium]|nr:hypothetical protein [Anaerolineales bacterium]